MSLTPEQIERTRYYRQLFELGEDKAARYAVVEAASQELGIQPRSVRLRWHTLGMSKKWDFMKPIVRKAVAKYPYMADRELAKRYNVVFSSFSCTRRRLRIPTCLDRRRAALKDEVALFVRDFPELSATEVRACIKADGDFPWHYSVRYIAELMDEVEVNDECAAS